MSDVENIYTKLALAQAVENCKKREISAYYKNMYVMARNAFPDEMKDVSLEQFAHGNMGYVPGRHGFGQQAQMVYLKQNKIPTLEPLSANGCASISLRKEADGTLYLSQGKETNITNVKSWDAYDTKRTNNRVHLFMMKTVDLGPFTDSRDGGHQENVFSEICTMIELVRDNALSQDLFRGLSASIGKTKTREMRFRLCDIAQRFFAIEGVDITIVIDGRLAEAMISEAHSRYQVPANIRLTTSEKL